MEPWKRVKDLGERLHTKGSSQTARPINDIPLLRALLGQTIYLLAETLRIMGILLQPFMPAKSGQMLDMLGVSNGKRTFDYAVMRRDFSYGVSKVSLGKGAHDSLFPPLEVED